MAIDLHKAITDILRNYGHDVLLQRRNADNTGWTYELERHTVRHNYPAVRGLPGITDEKREGIVNTVDILYYFRADAKPREGDRIYELDERFDGYDISGQTTWIVDHALPMRGILGEPVFFVCGVTREEPN